jgi:hypothetical protein
MPRLPNDPSGLRRRQLMKSLLQTSPGVAFLSRAIRHQFELVGAQLLLEAGDFFSPSPSGFILHANLGCARCVKLWWFLEASR